MKRIILTGGGTAGHVTPNLALIPELRENGFEISYIGSYAGMEKGLIEAEGVLYYGIATGKFRRYFDLKNFTDPFRVIKGYFQAKKYIREIKPDVLFSKGGFVSVPVVLAAHSCHVPAIIHESDMTPGLANKLCMSSATKICCNFPETMSKLPAGKAILSGSPIRRELMTGSREAGLTFTGLTGEKPILLMMGGSSGSVKVNEALRGILPEVLKTFDVIHLCGKGKLDESLQGTVGYVQYEYISEQLKDLFACADIILSRAGANAICEFVALKKPNILVPLSAKVSRGDQILNANSFKAQGFSYVIDEDTMTGEDLLQGIRTVYENRETYIEAMAKSSQNDAVDIIMGLIKELSE